MARKAAKREARRKRPEEKALLGMTSLMDAITIIVTYLLKSYSSDPVVIQPTQGQKVPMSLADTPIQDGIPVYVSQKSITFAEKRIVQMDETGAIDPSALQGHLIGPLYDLLAEEADKAKQMAEVNPSRLDLVEKLEKLIDAYNAGSIDVETFFAELKAFIAELDEEETRPAREVLSDEELAIFDLLTRPAPKLTKAQEVEVKRIARELLEKLRKLVAAVDWTKGQQTRGAVLTKIRVKLNALPEEPYPEGVWDTKVDAVWQFVLSKYASAHRA